MMSVKLLPFLKPYWWFDTPCLSSISSRSPLLVICSKIFPKVFSKQTGLYVVRNILVLLEFFLLSRFWRIMHLRAYYCIFPWKSLNTKVGTLIFAISSVIIRYGSEAFPFFRWFAALNSSSVLISPVSFSTSFPVRLSHLEFCLVGKSSMQLLTVHYPRVLLQVELLFCGIQSISFSLHVVLDFLQLPSPSLISSFFIVWGFGL